MRYNEVTRYNEIQGIDDKEHNKYKEHKQREVACGSCGVCRVTTVIELWMYRANWYRAWSCLVNRHRSQRRGGAGTEHHATLWVLWSLIL